MLAERSRACEAGRVDKLSVGVFVGRNISERLSRRTVKQKTRKVEEEVLQRRAKLSRSTLKTFYKGREKKRCACVCVCVCVCVCMYVFAHAMGLKLDHKVASPSR